MAQWGLCRSPGIGSAALSQARPRLYGMRPIAERIGYATTHIVTLLNTNSPKRQRIIKASRYIRPSGKLRGGFSVYDGLGRQKDRPFGVSLIGAAPLLRRGRPS